MNSKFEKMIYDFFTEMNFDKDEREAYEAQLERNVFSFDEDLHEELFETELAKIREELE